MIKVIKKGTETFEAKCKRCGCEFSYQLEDLRLGVGSETVDCPHCKHEYYHPDQEKMIQVKSTDFGMLDFVADKVGRLPNNNL